MGELLPIPKADSNGEFKLPVMFDGEADRNDVHDKELLHITTLIMPLIPSLNSGYDVLTVNKYQKNRIKALLRKHSFDDTIKKRYDIFGGHLTSADLSDTDKKSGSISFETIRTQALRELAEELKMYDNFGRLINPDSDKLVYIDKCSYHGKSNNELSYLFCYIADSNARNFIGSDDYIENDIKKDILLDTAILSLSHIADMSINVEKFPDSEVCDGLGRFFWQGINISEIITKVCGKNGFDININ